MKIKILLIIYFFIVKIVSAQTNLRDEALSLINAEIEITEKRIDILSQASEYDSGLFFLKTEGFKKSNYAKDYNSLIDRLRNLKTIKAEYQAKMIDGDLAISLFSKKSECDVKSCLEILGVVNQGLAKSISDITKSIVIQSWDKFSFYHTQNSIQKKASLSEFSKLQIRSWACERGLMQAKHLLSLDPVNLGVCFASVIMETAQELGTSPKLQNGLRFARPLDRNLSEWTDKHERVQKRIASAADYQLTPWALFRICAQEEKASLREALHLCYEVLRYNRGRPDMQRKLIDIRGDRSSGGDNAGDWYHLFGMAEMNTYFGNLTEVLYSIEPTRLFEILDGENRDLIETKNGLIGMNMGKTAEQTLKNFSGSNPRLLHTKTKCNLENILKKSGK